ncbi:Transposase IS630 [Neochlamydia sp. TUME1]|uniref:IS630 family transposase n=1 Tax=Neochlamydia sp. TUME1 TaxID=1478174 RepID=UPI0005826607|nr:IS630 family transposase [Neochlamydia sp. TUME1]KIC75474.1 Transposase IS630 [Neochlamydia sp. TUME1]
MFVAAYHTIKELNALAKRQPSARYSHPLRAIAMAMEGESAYQIGKALGYSTSTIQKWIRRYNHYHLERLQDNRPITTERKRAVMPQRKKAFSGRAERRPSPEESSSLSPLHDLPFTVKEELDKSLALPEGSKILGYPHYTTLTSRIPGYQANKKEYTGFKKVPEAIEALSNQFPKHKIEIWFEDEAKLGPPPAYRQGAAKKGKRPKVPKSIAYPTLYIATAICPALEKAEGLIFPFLNSKAIEHLLEQVNQSLPVSSHALLILDRAPYHVCKKLRIPPKVHLFFLSPPCPKAPSS